MIIPFWLKIAGPLVALALLIAGIMIWGNSKYRAGEKAGIEATHAAYKAASDKLKEDAAKSATRADDAAAKRLAEHNANVQEEQEAVNEALQSGTSPLDVLFGG